jgi:hypothetical protein
MANQRTVRRGARAKRTSDTNSARRPSPVKLLSANTAETPAVATPESSPAATD